MAISWPSGVPVGLLVVTPLKGFGRGNTVRNQTMSGRFTARRMSTKTSRRFDATMRISKAQFVTFDAWYHTTLKDGSLPFQGVTNPRTGVNTVWMFVADPDDENVPGTGNIIDISMQILALPDAPA
jgi:hypothetical protein